MTTVLAILLVVMLANPRRWRGRGLSRDRDDRRVDDLSARLAERDDELEAVRGRVAELENRLDFAERLLLDRPADRTSVAGASQSERERV